MPCQENAYCAGGGRTFADWEISETKTGSILKAFQKLIPKINGLIIEGSTNVLTISVRFPTKSGLKACIKDKTDTDCKVKS